MSECSAWVRTTAVAAALPLAFVLVLAVPGAAAAQEGQRAYPDLEPRGGTVNEAAAVARRVGEACVFGAAAGATAALLAGAPVAANGLGAPSVLGFAAGAAAVGCAVGFVGASAASGFELFWTRRVEPALTAPPAEPLPALPGRELRAVSDGDRPPIIEAVSTPALQ